MSSTSFEDLWTIMSQYTFKMESECSNDDLLCDICNKIMIDACQSICGCKYCYTCINKYLSGPNEYCPGNKVDCKEEKLVLDINFQRQILINKKISKVKVYCPNEYCLFKEELKKIEEHLRISTKQINKCPYVRIGCDDKESKDKILTHLHDNTWQHSHLLIDYVENMNNEGGGLKKNLEECKKEITSLKNMLRIKETMIKEQGRIIETILNDVKEIKEDSKEKEIQINREVECLKEKLRNKDDEMETLKRDILNFQNEKQSNMVTFKDENNIIEEITMNDKFKEESKKKFENVNTVHNVRKGEILFSLDRFSERKICGEIIYSPYFYSHVNGYKLRLQVHPGGWGIYRGTQLSVYLMICKGEHDDELSWPFKHSIEISVVNQKDGNCIKSIIFSHSYVSNKDRFNKPNSKDNDGRGSDLYLSHRNLKCIIGATVNDVVVIKCQVTAPA